MSVVGGGKREGKGHSVGSKTGLGEGKMGIGRRKRRVGMKYVKIKDTEVRYDDRLTDDNLYMALDGEVAGMQVGDAGAAEWEESTEEGEGEQEEQEGGRDTGQVEGSEDASAGWLRKARIVAQAGARKVGGDAVFGSRRAEHRVVKQVLQVVEVDAREGMRREGVGVKGGTATVGTGAEKCKERCTLKSSEVVFRSECDGELQAVKEGGQISHVGVKIGAVVEGVGIEVVKWAICRWRMVVKWKRYVVMGGVHWIRNEEGFVHFDADDIDMGSWSVNVEVFEEMVTNVDMFQEEKGLWCGWLVGQVAGLLQQCGAWRALVRGYLRRRFLWWWKWGFEKKLIKAKVAEKRWVCEMEERMLKKLVLRFWKQGWQATVKAAKLMGMVRERCGQIVTAIAEWRWRTAIALQDVWEGIHMLEKCMLRMWFCKWRDGKNRTALVISGGLIVNSVASKFLELVERQGYSMSAAAWKLVEEGEDQRAVLEIGEQMREYRK